MPTNGLRPSCSVPGCGRPNLARRLCNAHYCRWRIAGEAFDRGPATDFTIKNRGRAVWDRIMDRRLITPTGCWEWQGKRTPRGYGQLAVRERSLYVHRQSYEHHVGPIPTGLVVDHLCYNPPCFNPDHLEAVTQKENLRRSRDRRKAMAA